MVTKKISDLRIGQSFFFKALEVLNNVIIPAMRAEARTLNKFGGTNLNEDYKKVDSNQYTLLGPDPQYPTWFRVRNKETGKEHSCTGDNEVLCS